MIIKYKSSTLKVKSLISSQTSSGIVYNTSNPKLVVKFIVLKENSDVNEFLKEKYIGEKIDSKYGTTVRYASFLEPSKITIPLLKSKIINKNNKQFQYMIGYLIIDNLIQNKNEYSLSLKEYLHYYKYIWKACPSKFHPLFRMFRTSLNHLYSIGYYHGDLHNNNIHIITDSKYKLKYVKIIDFGSSQKFNKKKINSSCTASSLKQIKKEFSNFKSKFKETKHYGTTVKYNKNGNPFRSNNEMLKSYNKVFKYKYLHASIPRKT